LLHPRGALVETCLLPRYPRDEESRERVTDQGKNLRMGQEKRYREAIFST
jgi:hypothetical protein